MGLYRVAAFPRTPTTQDPPALAAPFWQGGSTTCAEYGAARDAGQDGRRIDAPGNEKHANLP